ncbi:hypothetical protein [Solidesulfovibrio magneticus]|uniref:hypothetical protein n=1 Tax=Solidesulfovibrio magneticus TaxID=184917 RepID=UPI0002E330CD|nr:hypothetical protein [Solidesulfovibrio magneticus]
MLLNKEEICAVLGIGRRRFIRYLKEVSPPMPVRFDGFSYIADREELLAWRRKFTKKAEE